MMLRAARTVEIDSSGFTWSNGTFSRSADAGSLSPA